MTSSMSLSTRHLWPSPHITSPQYVDKVCIWPFSSLLNPTFVCYCFSPNEHTDSCFSSTKKSVAVGCCSVQSIDRVLVAAAGEPRRSMCSFTGKTHTVERKENHSQNRWSTSVSIQLWLILAKHSNLRNHNYILFIFLARNM